MEGFIKLNRMITEWQWYKDPNTAHLFTHLLLMANHSEKKWRGIIISRGQHITSLHNLSSNTGLSVREVRTALQHLEDTGEILRKSTHQFTLLTVCSYDEYIDSEVTNAKETTHQRHTGDTQATTNNNDNNADNEKKPIYSAFYDHEINESGNDQNYISAVKILYGENNLGIKLTSVLNLQVQLSFTQFQRLWYLKEKFKFDMMEIFEAMENWKKLNGNKTVYKTFLTFAKRRNPSIEL